MTSLTFHANGLDLCKRSIIPSPSFLSSSNDTTPSSSQQQQTNEDTAGIKKSSSSSGPTPRAFIQLVGICCIYLDPPPARLRVNCASTTKANFRPDIFGDDVEMNQKLPLQKILKLLISRYDELLSRDSALSIFADTGLEEVQYSRESQKKASDIFLRSSDQPGEENEVELTIVIFDPFPSKIFLNCSAFFFDLL